MKTALNEKNFDLEHALRNEMVHTLAAYSATHTQR